MDITLFCPDSNFRFDVRTPDTVGIGGGKTALLRLAQALALQGHGLRLVANVTQEGSLDGVEHVSCARPAGESLRGGDLLIATSTSGVSNLGELEDLARRYAVSLLWLHGLCAVPPGAEAVPWSAAVGVSRAVCDAARPSLPNHVPTFTVYNGFWPATCQARPAKIRRDARTLVYAHHPDKSLAACLDVFAGLTERDPRWRLELCTSGRLWGQEDSDPPPLPSGATWRGMVPQGALAGILRESSFLFSISNRPEPGSLVNIEAKRCGALPIVSPLGGNPEYGRHLHDALVVEGDVDSKETREACRALLLELTQDESRLEAMRKTAMASGRSWFGVAEDFVNLVSWLE